MDGTACFRAIMRNTYNRLFRSERPYKSSRVFGMGNAVPRAFILLPSSYTVSAPLFLLSNSPLSTLLSRSPTSTSLMGDRTLSSAHSGEIMAVETFQLEFLIGLCVLSLFNCVILSRALFPHQTTCWIARVEQDTKGGNLLPPRASDGRIILLDDIASPSAGGQTIQRVISIPNLQPGHSHSPQTLFVTR